MFELGAYVAPYAGAWVEIFMNTSKFDWVDVAPYAGAWVEIILSEEQDAFDNMSLPTRERGLKLLFGRKKDNPKKSLPTRERGLKYVVLPL